MPGLTCDDFMESVEKLPRNMCSTPVFGDDSAYELTVSSSVNSSENDTFHEYYHNIEWELDKLNKIKILKEKYLHKTMNLFLNSMSERMLDQWGTLKEKTDYLEKSCSLEKNIKDLHDSLFHIKHSMPNMTSNVKDKTQLERIITTVKTELTDLEDKKRLIEEYNAQVHRLVTDSKYPVSSLKEEIRKLYFRWEEAQQHLQNQIKALRDAFSMWEYFDMHMSELKTALREDQDVLNVLDKVLKDQDTITPDLATSMKNISKYLPDKQHNLIKMNHSGFSNLDFDHGDCMSNILMNTLNIEGSFSDSGISDSGSEHDLCEREKRLVTLKKLARLLESVMAPDSDALMNMMKRIEETEQKIHELKLTCRTLIKSTNEEKKPMATKKEKLHNESSKETKLAKKTKSDDPESDPGKGRSVFWKVLKTALPFHMAMLVLICVACLLEPNCCDAINNWNFSLSPQLRYLSGPPPT